MTILSKHSTTALTSTPFSSDGTLLENVAPEQLLNNVVSSPLAISDLSAEDHDGVYSCSLSNVADQDTHKEKSTTTITLTTLGI